MPNDLALNILPEDYTNKNAKTTNVSIDGEICSLADLEKIFFLSKINSNPEFISLILKINVKKIDSIIHSLQFQDIMNEYLSEYMNGSVGEPVEQLTMRYQDFLKELFVSIRVSVGMRVRDSLANDKPLREKYLYITILEKLMKMEFALRGVPVDLKGILHGSKKESKDKTNDELIKSLNEIKEAVTEKEKGFNPNSFIDQGESDAEILEVNDKEIAEEENEIETKQQSLIDKE